MELLADLQRHLDGNPGHRIRLRPWPGTATIQDVVTMDVCVESADNTVVGNQTPKRHERCHVQLEEYFDFLAEDDIRIKGTRIGIESVLYAHLHGSQSPQAIAARFPALRLEQVYATITYYLHNEDAVRQYLANWLEHGRRMRDRQAKSPSPAVARMRQTKVDRRMATPAEN